MVLTSRERLMATLRSEPVDRPAVNFYEIGGFDIDPADPDPFNIFGNIEASAVENAAPRDFEALVRRALAEGTAGAGRGFVLMPSASPYGRRLSPRAIANYRAMVRRADEWGAGHG